MGAAAAGAAGALAYHQLAEHREEFAHQFGPGHEAPRDRAFLHDHERDFHTRDVRHFDERELRLWRDGRWHQDWHYGRWGWWYDVGDVWYPYGAPVYPYPVEVSEVVVPDATMVAEGPGVIAGPAGPGYMPGPVAISTVAPSGVEVVVRPLPPAPIVNYRCPTPDGFYPGVHLCPAVWSVVP
jgi:hypothetical protein